ncbi:PREDICTED: serum factor response D-like [Brassica oleracea var. oleracea]|uniref:serum factor response D-like n=1 Tax=Brassica oleracea var. oleracea TaxID=109376 RepID=UPI0006A72EBC|nr:PREDICTED: serum factor response D-like [Brassica oleracea var. oleracea]
MAATNTSTERVFGVTNIKTHIPLILDLDECNYDAWRELLLMHCLTFDVLGHIDGSSTPTGDDDVAWHKRDAIVKFWLYGTLAKPLFKSTFQKGGNAHDVWSRIENQFRNNKEVCAMQLDNDLRNKAIGDLSVHEYCQELKSTADLLSNLDAPVADKTLVMYMLNGLNEKFDYVLNVIKHQKPFPTFEEAKNMLEMEETRLKKTQKVTASHNDHSSSSSALVATTPTNLPQQQHNNHRSNSGCGNRRGNKFRGRYNNNNNFHQRPNYNNWNPPPFWYGPNNNNWQQPPHASLMPCKTFLMDSLNHVLMLSNSRQLPRQKLTSQIPIWCQQEILQRPSTL